MLLITPSPSKYVQRYCVVRVGLACTYVTVSVDRRVRMRPTSRRPAPMLTAQGDRLLFPLGILLNPL